MCGTMEQAWPDSSIESFAHNRIFPTHAWNCLRFFSTIFPFPPSHSAVVPGTACPPFHPYCLPFVYFLPTSFLSPFLPSCHPSFIPPFSFFSMWTSVGCFVAWLYFSPHANLDGEEPAKLDKLLGSYYSIQVSHPSFLPSCILPSLPPFIFLLFCSHHRQCHLDGHSIASAHTKFLV